MVEVITAEELERRVLSKVDFLTQMGVEFASFAKTEEVIREDAEKWVAEQLAYKQDGKFLGYEEVKCLNS